MLTRLQVKNYVLIDSLEIDFPEGLIIITGQTGAGKSILLGALTLIMGAKADAAMVSEGADNCVVEAEFDSVDDTIKSLLEDNEVEWEAGHLIIRRVVNRSGRSRAFVNDSPVPVTLLQDIAGRIIDIHSQHQTLLLSDRHFQLGMLDDYAGNVALRAKCAELWNKLSGLKTRLASVEASIASAARDRDYNDAQLRQLEAAALAEGELAALEEEQKQLANAEEIKNCLSGAEELFSPSSNSEMMPVDTVLKEIDRMLSRVARFVPEATELAERVVSCRRELDDVYSEISSMNSRVDMSGDRLIAVEDRMSLIYGLLQKHGCADESELIALRDRLSSELFGSEKLQEEAEELRASIRSVSTELESVADQLHTAREMASASFALSIQDSVRSLEMPYAVFEVSIADAPLSVTGHDYVTFRFSSTGRNPIELSKCASGGEMSRIMLALKEMMSRFSQMPTMIFDEIDTGVSGSVADKMGSMICEMGQNMQVFAITHLPQVAAKGSAHYLVEKNIGQDGKAVSTIKRISGEDRIAEVARMLSGSVLTSAAMANAKSLLGID
jgi:DNA repair protein RecN (Recombination protein N)